MNIGSTTTRIELWMVTEDIEERWPRLYRFWDWVVSPFLAGFGESVRGLRRWLR